MRRENETLITTMSQETSLFMEKNQFDILSYDDEDDTENCKQNTNPMSCTASTNNTQPYSENTYPT